jgi:hypothetical protein
MRGQAVQTRSLSITPAGAKLAIPINRRQRYDIAVADGCNQIVSLLPDTLQQRHKGSAGEHSFCSIRHLFTALPEHAISISTTATTLAVAEANDLKVVGGY